MTSPAAAHIESLSAPSSAFCIGVDVGGTFTDVVLSDGSSVWRAKAPSSHGAIGDGVIHACRLVAERAGATLDELLPQVDRFGLGTTAVTNVIASRVGRRIGLVTTRGFEDLVPIARVRRIPTDGWLVPPDSLIERECIRGVAERIDRNGTVLESLDPAEAVAAARILLDEQNIEALAVSFLWSCINPAHEQAAVTAIEAAIPGLSVVSGADLLPVMREYERSTFALLNAYTSGALAGIDALVEELMAHGLRNPPLLIHSGGGSISIVEGRRTPAMLAESGPAAGVVGALAVCEAAGVRDAVACDMGGTSFDMSIIRDGEAVRRSRGELMGIWTALPMVDIELVTAGGGSIGWVDPVGFLRVGPLSAGARPGPACYGRGGSEPTVTDALVVLGYLDPGRFLGGGMALDVAAATAACEKIGQKIGADARRAAWGIHEVARTEMVRALRAQFAQRGLDPRDFAMVSMGGCGGLFNAVIAQDLGMRRMLAPQLTSVLSAFGAATADVRRERSRSLAVPLPCGAEQLRQTAETLRRAVDADLAADGIGFAARRIRFELDLRFARQQWELSVSASEGFGPDAQAALVARFKDEYGRRYGEGAIISGAPVELVTVRAVGEGETVRARLSKADIIDDRPATVAGHRTIHVDTAGAMTASTVAVYDGDLLRPGHHIAGPALIDASDTTIWLPPGTHARLDAHSTLDIQVRT